MKRLTVLTLLFRFRAYAQDTYDLISKIYDRVGELEKLITNHLFHKLEDHDKQLSRQGEQLTHIETKIDTIVKKLGS